MELVAYSFLKDESLWLVGLSLFSLPLSLFSLSLSLFSLVTWDHSFANAWLVNLGFCLEVFIGREEGGGRGRGWERVRRRIRKKGETNTRQRWRQEPWFQINPTPFNLLGVVSSLSNDLTVCMYVWAYSYFNTRSICLSSDWTHGFTALEFISLRCANTKEKGNVDASTANTAG